ncbi:MAG: bifunctional hydroxymethylpyrimidine kinase/phosphomethylpyrimidine kinase [Verrucomicrobiae bacterium]|nr:bifunctional hydroxymethylpyrimidine kinase/phosphomethylpyrimidine kinase [Verrucomicrobiae bacterium]NNJ42162.1 bifunctional hydroxymethylpyrimidine kinase/phosphomethylpyrimidine kinase [Akkermansiaceae bacterium]
MPPTPPIALTIAGSDCSGGAGIQADLKTFQHFGVHGLSAITSIVAETPLEVRQWAPVDIPLLQDQINIVLDTYSVSVVKTGLLPSLMVIIAVAEILEKRNIPLVVDPVMIASTGTSLIHEDTSGTLSSRLLPITTLVTPNMSEASALLNRDVTTRQDLEAAARDIAETYHTSCLLKGGHLPGNGDRLDMLWHDGLAYPFSHPMCDIPKGIHGTGCTLSAAIAAGLAHRQPLETAVEKGIHYVQQLIQDAHMWHHNGQTIQCLGW